MGGIHDEAPRRHQEPLDRQHARAVETFLRSNGQRWFFEADFVKFRPDGTVESIERKIRWSSVIAGCVVVIVAGVALYCSPEMRAKCVTAIGNKIVHTLQRAPHAQRFAGALPM